MNKKCDAPGCDHMAELEFEKSLCQDHWEEFCSYTWWEYNHGEGLPDIATWIVSLRSVVN